MAQPESSFILFVFQALKPPGAVNMDFNTFQLAPPYPGHPLALAQASRSVDPRKSTSLKTPTANRAFESNPFFQLT